jgi:hypothetical protein
MAKQPSMTRAYAEDLAVAALAFIAQDAERLQRFLALSGLSPLDIREAAADPGFLAGVIDHVSQDEALLVSFAADSGIDPAEVATARRLLSEGE